MGEIDDENTHSFKNTRMIFATRITTQADVMRITFAGGIRKKVSVLIIKDKFFLRKCRPPKEPFVLPTNKADSTSASTRLDDEEGEGVKEDEDDKFLVRLAVVEGE